jgi:CubicO group peptidase (beta-lactamase class C family)
MSCTAVLLGIRFAAFVSIRIVSCGLPVFTAAPAAALQDQEPGNLASVTKLLEQETTRVLEATGIPSISLALVREGQVAWTHAQGYANVGARVPATTDTYYSTGSTFKFVTATAVMQFVERGRLTLDTPLNDLVTEDLAVAGADDVTVRHLLSHHSGLDAFSFGRRINFEGPVSTVPLWSRRANFTARELLANTRRIGPPGVRFQYSNDGYAIVSYLVETLAHQPFDHYVARYVFRPLGVDLDRLTVPDARVVEHMALPYELSDHAPTPIAQVRYDAVAAGDVYLRPRDMARFVAAHLNDGEFHGKRILTRDSAREMRRAQFGDRSYGLGIQVQRLGEHDVITHTGSIPGFNAFLVADPATRQGVYVMTNARSAGQDRVAARAIAKLAHRTMLRLWGEEVTALSELGTPVEVRVSPELLDEYAGEYAITSTRTFTFTRDGDRFFVQVGGGPRREVFASSETDFFLRTGVGTVTFGRDEDGGPVTHLIHHRGGGDERAERVR